MTNDEAIDVYRFTAHIDKDTDVFYPSWIPIIKQGEDGGFRKGDVKIVHKGNKAEYVSIDENNAVHFPFVKGDKVYFYYTPDRG